MKKISTFCILAMMFIASTVSAQWAMKAQQSFSAWTSATAQDTALAVPVVSYSTVAVTLSATSTMTAGTLNFELSNDNGSTYPFAIACVRTDSAAYESTFALAVTSKSWQCSVGGFTHFRIRLNPAITGSGTATVRIQATQAPMQAPVVSAVGQTSTSQGVPDSGTQRVLIAQKATYSFATTAKTATAAGTGPFFSICGSSTKTVRLQQLIIGGSVATAAVYGDVELTKTSAATSSGTATALTKVPHDSSSAASTANLLNFYTALATAGTPVGKIGSQTAVFPITGTVAASAANVVFDWTNRQESEAPVLRGTAQCLEASFGTTPANAPTLTVQGIYTEE
jgi:hypothetical protein